MADHDADFNKFLKQGKLFTAALLCVGGMSLIILGRFESFHMTEGEALVNYWVYWLLGGAFCLGALYMINHLDESKGSKK